MHCKVPQIWEKKYFLTYKEQLTKSAAARPPSRMKNVIGFETMHQTETRFNIASTLTRNLTMKLIFLLVVSLFTTVESYKLTDCYNLRVSIAKNNAVHHNNDMIEACGDECDGLLIFLRFHNLPIWSHVHLLTCLISYLCIL